MKTAKFAYYLNKFFTVYLPNTNGSTPMTIDSYRYAFILFLTFMEEKGTPADSIEISDLTYHTVLEFLEWLQAKRKNSVATRNQRQTALNSFISYLMYEFPDYLVEFQLILGIPIKKAPQKEISYLKTEGVKLLFEQININTRSGFRNYTMLTLLYTTGIRVSELINIKVKDISLHYPATLLVHGKGQKSRYVPLVSNTVKILEDYIVRYGLDKEYRLNDWLFKNHMKEQFKRQGINYIIKKYADLARIKKPDLIPEDFSPHKMRHTTAMGLVDSGVDLIYIRDLLGHVSVKTTEVYARADATKKREAIEAASKEIVPKEDAEWDNNTRLKDWLKNFNRR
ncbi:tyrosine-type recombinase/integrase [Thermoanaerobacterium sp. RBIITD]|uniref:tyrosine-type recombinase/integrase n=1 Tax=Thermoanaerobacterium sp. RBIITD TaxID=1550240 RepID=UPI000BB6DEB5|nr:tyrosine-type recombinase/integrase [Thermoanaerobacterium sp. RBIITD]SNX52727.1 Site-specific recombinase XerD [Thermoanaerobacterium sp. RBIITD]